MKLSLQPKLVEKLVLGPSYFDFVKLVTFLVMYVFDTLLCQNWLLSHPNHETLRRTLMVFQGSNNFNKYQQKSILLYIFGIGPLFKLLAN
jgi:hypothetical protein